MVSKYWRKAAVDDGVNNNGSRPTSTGLSMTMATSKMTVAIMLSTTMSTMTMIMMTAKMLMTKPAAIRGWRLDYGIWTTTT